jgi:hypothetical protein
MRRFLPVLALLLAWNAAFSEPAPSVRLRSRTFVPLADHFDVRGRSEDRVHVLVGLRDRTDPVGARAALASRGVDLLRYVPDHAWIASGHVATFGDPDVRSLLGWGMPLQPTDKLPRRLAEGRPGAWAVRPGDRVEVRVRLHDDVVLADARSRIEALGAEIGAEHAIFSGASVVVPIARLNELAALDEVLWIGESLPEPRVDNDGSRAATGADPLQENPYNLSGNGERIGIWDAGRVDPAHPDFAGRLTIVDSVPTQNHSTHVAGTFGGSGAASAGRGGTPLQWRGIAPEVGIYSWDFQGDIISEIESGVAAFDLDVETNSWGFGVDDGNCEDLGDYDFLAPEFDAIVRGSGGQKLVVTFSAGNERDDGDCPLTGGGYACINPPKAAKNIIVVGATNSDNDTMTGFSSWGPVDDGRLRPDVTAPGCEDGGEGYIRSTLPGGGYGGNGWCGTSMAAPVVAGGAALLLEMHTALYGAALVEPSLVKGLLVATAQDLGTPEPDYAFGHGRVALQAAVEAMMVDTQSTLTLAHGQVVDLPFTVPAGIPELRVALVWDDPDAAPLAAPALVNDLDLVLIAPDAAVIRPWVLNPGNPSAPAVRGADHLNNVEHVRFPDPAPGAWVARVTGTNVPEGPQVASLVGLDDRPPALPTGFVVAGASFTSLDLSWTNATASDRRGSLIVRSEGSPPGWFGPSNGATYTVGQVIPPGIEVVYVADEDHSSTPFTDGDLESMTTYYYAAYSFDDFHNYSLAARASGTTLGTTGVVALGSQPTSLSLGAAIPNPAVNETAVAFGLPEDGRVRLTVYDAAGRHVRTLVNDALSRGAYSVSWDGRDVRGRPISPGIYFTEIRFGGRRLTRSVSWLP